MVRQPPSSSLAPRCNPQNDTAGLVGSLADMGLALSVAVEWRAELVPLHKLSVKSVPCGVLEMALRMNSRSNKMPEPSVEHPWVLASNHKISGTEPNRSTKGGQAVLYEYASASWTSSKLKV